MLIAGILSSLLTRYGIQIADKRNWMPRNHYQKKALDCLKSDDIEGALLNCKIVSEKDSEYKEAQVVQELIKMTLDEKRELLEKKKKKTAQSKTNLYRQFQHSKIKKYLFSFAYASAAGFPAVVAAIFAKTENIQQNDTLLFLGIVLYELLIVLLFMYYNTKILFNPKRSPVIAFHDHQSKFIELTEKINEEISETDEEIFEIEVMLDEINTLIHKMSRLEENTNK